LHPITAHTVILVPACFDAVAAYVCIGENDEGQEAEEKERATHFEGLHSPGEQRKRLKRSLEKRVQDAIREIQSLGIVN
jgi:hypothetical protein